MSFGPSWPCTRCAGVFFPMGRSAPKKLQSNCAPRLAVEKLLAARMCQFTSVVLMKVYRGKKAVRALLRVTRSSRNSPACGARTA